MPVSPQIARPEYPRARRTAILEASTGPWAVTQNDEISRGIRSLPLTFCRDGAPPRHLRHGHPLNVVAEHLLNPLRQGGQAFQPESRTLRVERLPVGEQYYGIPGVNQLSDPSCAAVRGKHLINVVVDELQPLARRLLHTPKDVREIRRYTNHSLPTLGVPVFHRAMARLSPIRTV